MNSFKIPYNQIENKIRQFKAGVDYRWKAVYNPSAHKIKLPEHETLFCLYAWYWLVPEARPSFREIFAKTLDKGDRRDRVGGMAGGEDVIRNVGKNGK